MRNVAGTDPLSAEPISCIGVVLVCAVLCSCAGGSGRAGECVLVEDGKALASIVVADEPLPINVETRGKPSLTVRHAAEELQYFIREASGVELPITTPDEASEDGALVLVGRSRLTDELGIAPPERPEAFRVRVTERAVAVVGEIGETPVNRVLKTADRGTLHGVYEFLEHALDFRFYFHMKDDPLFGVCVPKLERVAVPVGASLDMAPDFPHRVAGFPTWHDPAAWRRSTRGGSATGFRANHTDAFWNRYYGEEHPEYFLLKEDGTRDMRFLCYSQPELVDLRVEEVKRYYETGKWRLGWVLPGEQYIPIVPSDPMMTLCACEQCRRAAPKNPKRYDKYSRIVFAHGAAFARKAKKLWPDKRVAMLAYEGYMEPPDMELPDNLDVMVCLMWPTTTARSKEEFSHNMRIMKEWSRLVGGRRERLFTWDYHCWPAFWTEGPLVFPHVLQRWLKATRELQSGCFVNPGGYTLAEGHVMNWMWHRLMWDVNADVDALLVDYCKHFYGPAAEPMHRAWNTLARAYEGVVWDPPARSAYIDPERMYGQTYTPRVTARFRKALDAARKAVASLDAEDLPRRRVEWMIDEWKPFLRQADLTHAWLGGKFRVETRFVKSTPKRGEDWAKARTVVLLKGNDGDEPDVKTEAGFLREKGMLHVLFKAESPDAPADGDRLRVTLRPRTKDAQPMTAEIGPEAKTLSGNWTGRVFRNEVADGVWTAQVALDLRDVPEKDLRFGSVPMQIDRVRVVDGKPVEYHWVPPMAAPWEQPTRTGRLEF